MKIDLVLNIIYFFHIQTWYMSLKSLELLKALRICKVIEGHLEVLQMTFNELYTSTTQQEVIN